MDERVFNENWNGWRPKEEVEQERETGVKSWVFFPFWFSIRGTRGDKTKRAVTQRNNPSSVPPCSCCSSLLPSSLQFPQIPAEIRVSVHRDGLLTSSASYRASCTLTATPHNTSVTAGINGFNHFHFHFPWSALNAWLKYSTINPVLYK